MKILKTIDEWLSFRASINDQHIGIGFVPTMGHLHAGHLSLIDLAQQENDMVVVSIFVNPTQFNNPDDLQSYPRSLQDDIAKLRSANVDAVFVPQIQAMYPMEYRYQVKEMKFSRLLEGKHRTGHFDGVLTVVLKLFNLVRPRQAFFGEKDYQQYQLIKDMVKALFLPVEVIACPTVRDEAGLALSSRNSRLSDEGVGCARQFAKTLAKSVDSADVIRQQLEAGGYAVDYVEDYQGRRYAAICVGGVRLIDNVELSE